MPSSVTIATNPALANVVWSCPSLLVTILAIAFCIGSLMLLLAPLYLHPNRLDS